MGWLSEYSLEKTRVRMEQTEPWVGVGLQVLACMAPLMGVITAPWGLCFFSYLYGDYQTSLLKNLETALSTNSPTDRSVHPDNWTQK